MPIHSQSGLPLQCNTLSLTSEALPLATESTLGSLSGTNSLGPVNPFEFFSAPAQQSVLSQEKDIQYVYNSDFKIAEQPKNITIQYPTDPKSCAKLAADFHGATQTTTISVTGLAAPVSSWEHFPASTFELPGSVSDKQGLAASWELSSEEIPPLAAERPHNPLLRFNRDASTPAYPIGYPNVDAPFSLVSLPLSNNEHNSSTNSSFLNTRAQFQMQQQDEPQNYLHQLPTHSESVKYSISQMSPPSTTAASPVPWQPQPRHESSPVVSPLMRPALPPRPSTISSGEQGDSLERSQTVASNRIKNRKFMLGLMEQGGYG
jgi:hypothetical protein